MGDSDLVILKLDSNGMYQNHTFYGASGKYDNPYNIALDKNQGIYVTGELYATWQGDGNTDPLNPFSGNNDWPDGFILKLADPAIFPVYLPVIHR